MTSTGKIPDLLVVGGGVVGLAVAREAAIGGMEVTVLERARPGRQASWAAAGMLSPLGEARQTGPFLELALASLRMYPAWVRELEEESGEDLEYRESGKLRVAFSHAQMERLEARARWAEERSVPARRLDREEVLAREPHLTSRVLGGLLVEEDHQLENRRLGDALATAASGRGAKVRTGTEVKGFQVSGGRIQGVRLGDGSTLPAGRVVLAAGAWSGTFPGLPWTAPVSPVRGQILSLLPEALPSSHILESEDIYLVPRSDGRLVVGATQEEAAGFREVVTAQGVRNLLEGALALVPGLATAPLSELWSGLRPGTPDRNPLIGPDPQVEGLFLATGHFRNGILLAPITALMLRGLLLEAEEPAVPEAFLPRRFRSGGEGRPHLERADPG